LHGRGQFLAGYFLSQYLELNGNLDLSLLKKALINERNERFWRAKCLSRKLLNPSYAARWGSKRLALFAPLLCLYPFFIYSLVFWFSHWSKTNITIWQSSKELVPLYFGEKDIIEQVEEGKDIVELTIKLHTPKEVREQKYYHIVLQIIKEQYEEDGSPKIGESYTHKRKQFYIEQT
jgi:hypothetical protein